MCAIVGMLSLGGYPAPGEVVSRMTSSLAHRGPDGEGILSRGPVAFGHRRLSIIDRAGGKQPMTNEDGQVWVTFNGEIYNHRELAAELKKRGHIFHSNSDTEVIVHAWEQWGEDCVKRFRGMFAFGIADWRQHKIFLARDHFGIKPLYFIRTPQAVAFASEIQALRFVPGFDAEPDITAMDQFLWLQYIPAPRSIFKQVQKLPPAHCMTLDMDGKTSGPGEYWKVAFEPYENPTGDEWVEAVDATVADSVKAHLMSDVPFGAFLSGGVDSSLVVANMSRMLGRPVQTFSIGFEDREFDETSHAAFAAQATGADHHVEIVKPDALGILPELVRHYGEPFGDSSAVPTFYLSKLARQNVPMVLSGDGADEMFGGYWSHGDWMTRWANRTGAKPQLEDWLEFIQYTNTPSRLNLWRPEFRGQCPAPMEFFNHEWSRAGGFSLAGKVQYMDLKTYLPFDILTKVDVASMYHGLEVRTPMVDLRVIELAAKIPDRFHLKQGQNGQWERKQLLKRVAAKYFPAEFLNRPKMGFAIPIAKWFAPGGKLHLEIRERLLGPGSTLKNYFETGAIQQLLSQGAFGPLWLLTFLEEWLRQNKTVAPADLQAREIHSHAKMAVNEEAAKTAVEESKFSANAKPTDSMNSQPLPTIKTSANRPRVLLIADVPNWIFERHAHYIHALLSDDFDFTLAYQGKKFNEDDFDLIYPLEFNLIDHAAIRNPRKYVTGIRSHLSWQPLDFLGFVDSLKNKFSGVHVVSERLLNIFQPFVPSVECISHGVDTGFFTPSKAADQSGKKLRLGWAGNRLSGSKKGFKEIIEPLGRLPSVELVFCGYNDRNLSLEQMKGFYDSLDAYVCASDFEGNNNSVMEAASMKRAIITTDSGAVPEYLRNGESALVVEREFPHFMRAVVQLRDDPALRVRLGEAARIAVQGKFDWKAMGEVYRKFFWKSLNERRPSGILQSLDLNPVATSPAGETISRRPGYSFCIITNGKRPEKLAAEIASIRALQIPAFEILVGGEAPAGLTGVTVLDLPDAARNGRLGEMRNRLIQASQYDHIVVADDDLIFKDDFYKGLCEFGEDYEVLCTRFLNNDGTRYWDWATVGGPRGHSLLDYDETDSNVYVTGGLCVMKAAVAERVQWDEKRGFYQGEDIDFSNRLHGAGISIKFNRFSTVVHTDPRYTQVGSRILNWENVRDLIAVQVKEGRLEEARNLHARLRKADPVAAAEVEREVSPALDSKRLSLPVRWRGPVFNTSGYASEAINFLLPLSERVEVGLFHQNNIYSEKFVAGLAEKHRNRLFSLRDRYPFLKGGIVIEHNPANGFSHSTNAVYRIGRTMFETDRVPKGWVESCNRMDEIWVPSHFNLETFAAAGVEKDKLFVIPESVDETEFDPSRHQPLPLPNRAKFNFLSIFEWSARKGWDVLLAAYLREFSAEDDVCLYLRTYLFSKPDGDPTVAIQRLIDGHAEKLNLGGKRLPRIHIIAEQVPQEDLPRLYKAADCLVAPSRGEGWGRPHHEAMLMGVPVIATNWSGNTEFMTHDNSYLVDYEIKDVVNLEPELRHYRGHRWANPSETSLRAAMRRVLENPAEAKAKGARAREDMLRGYTRGPVTDILVARLQEIERKISTPALPAAAARSIESFGLPSVEKPANLRVAWEGSFLDFGSLSNVNREMTAALSRETRIQLTRVGEKNISDKLKSQPDLQSLSRRIEPAAPKNMDVTVRHSWPPKWNMPSSGAWVMIQPWEYGVIPAEWVQKLANVDEVWAPSEHVRRVYVDSGVPTSKVKVVPNGIDPARFNPDAKPFKLATSKKFKFLFVGGTIARKGADLLLKTYLQTFTAKDDVCLVIKDFGGDTVYQGQTLGQQIRAAQSNPDSAEILHLTEELPTESIPGLYTACDCLVHPYRGEGFGLPILEAMACALPVIVTGGGASDDFATDEFVERIPALKTLIGDSVSGMKLPQSGWWLEPDANALAAKMRQAASHPEAHRAKARAGSEHVRKNFTWEKVARLMSRRLQEVVARKQAAADAVAARRSRKMKAIALPPAAHLGSLAVARENFSRHEFARAWSATLEAILLRPFNPPAFLMLAEIALAAGSGDVARKCAGHALALAPGWKPARHFLNGTFKGHAAPEWMALPPALQNENAAPKLTVCLITKNEEKFLGKCLASLKGLARQIVVTDTGSNDRTVEIAREFGAEIHSFRWCNDFSAARNAALEHVRGDWVLFLDADEELMPEHRETLLREMNSPATIGFRLPIVDVGHEKEGCSYVPRLFRNAPALFYAGRVHEQIFSSLLVRGEEWGLKVELGKSALLHHGYTKELVASRDKIARNLHLLEMAVEEMPNEPNLLMNLGLELVRSGQLEEGLEQTLEAFHILSRKPSAEVAPELRETLLTQLTTHLMSGKAFQEIVNIWKTPFASSAPMNASQHFLLGLSLLELKQPQAAIAQFKQCLAKRDTPGLTPAKPEIFGGAPQHLIATAQALLDDPKSADIAFQKALEEDPASMVIRFDYANFKARHGEPLEALRLFTAIVYEDPTQTAAWFHGAKVALSRPEFLGFALDWTGAAVQALPECPPLWHLRAEALLLSGDADAALPLWRNRRDANSPRHEAALVLCEVLAGGTATLSLAHPEPAVAQEFLKWYRQFLAYKAGELAMRINSHVEEYSRFVPSATRLLGGALKLNQAAGQNTAP